MVIRRLNLTAWLSIMNQLPRATVRLSLAKPGHALAVAGDIQSLVGFSEDDFVAGRVALNDLIHADDRDIADLLFSRSANPASGDFNLRLRRSNGRVCCVRGSFRKDMDASGQPVTLTLQLQDAKSLVSEGQVQSMAVNFTAMMENTDDYIYFKDRNHVFTGASQTLVALTSPAEHWTDLIGLTDYDVFPEPYADVYYRLEKQVFSGVAVASEIQETLEKSGKKGWVDNRKYPIYAANGEILGLFGVARDVTALKAAQASLQLQIAHLSAVESQHRELLTHLHTGIVVHAPDTRIIFHNPSAARLLGLTDEQMLGKTAMDPAWSFIDKDGQTMTTDQYPINRVLASVQPINDLVLGVRHNAGASVVWLSVYAFAEFDEDGGLKHVVVNFQDITARKHAEAEIWREANYDQLTQLPNRRLFLDRLEQGIKKAHRDGGLMALMFMDLDHFKEINDTLGHHVGDILLIEVAKRIQRCVRDIDTVGRLGGDEFVVILSDLKDTSSVGRIAKQIIEKMSEPFRLSDEDSFISASLGIALYPDNATSTVDLIKYADQAMYAAKDHGRNCFRFFQPPSVAPS